MGGDEIAYRQTFTTLGENLRNFLHQINIPEAAAGPTASSEFQLEEYFAQTLKIAEKLGFEANKITIMWTNPPVSPPQDILKVCAALELAGVALLNSYHSLPSALGTTLKGRLKNAIQGILENSCSFATTLLNSVGKTFPKDQHPAVSVCGLLLQNCEDLKELPRNNKAACAVALLAEANVIKDALKELDEARSSEGFMDEFDTEETWTDEDKLIINPLLGMIKTSGALTKRCIDTVKRENTSITDPTTYDVIVQQFSRVSPAVDDLALTIYPPLNWEEAKQEAWKLKEILESIVAYLDPLLEEQESKSKLQFINKAVAHNAAEIQRVFIQHGLAQLSISPDP